MKTATFYKYFTGCYFTLFLFIQFSRCRLHHYMKVWVVASGMALQDPYWCTYPYSHLFSQSGLTQTVMVPRLSCFWSGETLGSRHPAAECAVELLAPQWAVAQWLICCLHVCLSPPAHFCAAETVQGEVLSSLFKEIHTKGSCLSLQE